MRVIDPGHEYELDVLDSSVPAADVLTFVKREGEKYPGNVGHHPGTNIQEVLRALIDRVKYLNLQVYDDRNVAVLDHLRTVIMLLEHRAAERHGRPALAIDRLDVVEHLLVCKKCGHIGCGGECHATT